MKKFISTFILVCFIFTGQIGPFFSICVFAYAIEGTGNIAQDFALPAPGVMVGLSPEFNPPILKGIKVHPDNPFRFDFILDRGDSKQNSGQLKEESSKLIKYFLASLTIPEKDLWVNLSPYEKDRIIPQSFGFTEMGRDLLAEDYMLKQITASLIYPEGEVGRKFWKRVYEQAAKKFGTTNIPVSTFNKVWIVPEKAVVYENAQAGTAYIVESKLKVMLEQDYLSLQKHVVTLQKTVILSAAKDLKVSLDSLASPQNDISSLGSNIVREIIIPELTKEINEDKNFSQLRQVYNSLILATWYKKKIKDSILEQVYANKKKVKGLSFSNASVGNPQYIYQQYLKAFKKGVYNYIKEEADPITNETTPRKYFSGGVTLLVTRISAAMSSQVPQSLSNAAMVTADLSVFHQDQQKLVNPAMMTTQYTWQQFVVGGLSEHPPWEKDSNYRFGVENGYSGSEDLIILQEGLMPRYGIKLKKNLVGLDIGFGANPEELELIYKLFKLRQLLGVEQVNTSMYPRIERAAKYLLQKGYSPSQFRLYQAQAGKLKGVIPSGSVDFIYTNVKQWRNYDSHALADDIVDLLSPGGMAYIGVDLERRRVSMPWDDVSIVDILRNYGEIKPFAGEFIFVKSRNGRAKKRVSYAMNAQERQRLIADINLLRMLRAGRERDRILSEVRIAVDHDPQVELRSRFVRRLMKWEMYEEAYEVAMEGERRAPNFRNIQAQLIELEDILQKREAGRILAIERGEWLIKNDFKNTRYVPIVVALMNAYLNNGSQFAKALELGGQHLADPNFINSSEFKAVFMRAHLLKERAASDAMTSIVELKGIVDPIAEKVYRKVESKVRQAGYKTGPVYTCGSCGYILPEFYKSISSRFPGTLYLTYYNSKYYLLDHTKDLFLDTKENPGFHKFVIVKYQNKFFIVDPTWQQFLPLEERSDKKDHVLIAELRDFPEMLESVNVPMSQRHIWRNAIAADPDIVQNIRRSSGYEDFKVQDVWPDPGSSEAMASRSQRDLGARQGKSEAMTGEERTNTGGIDLTSNKFLQTQNVAKSIKFHLDPAMLAQLQNASGLVPVIINIQPMTDLRQFLGLKVQESIPASASSVL